MRQREKCEDLNNNFFSDGYGSVAQPGRALGFYNRLNLATRKQQSFFEVTQVSRVQIPSGPFFIESTKDLKTQFYTHLLLSLS